MQKGYNNKLVGQAGEYLVASELSRRGLIATTFTGNVPHYDIVASDEDGRHVSVQVKAVRRGSWQGDISKYCEISFDGRKQIISDEPKKCPIKRLVMVFVQLSEKYGDDRFYILTWEEFRDVAVKHHKDYLKAYKGIRPKKFDSLHFSVSEETLAEYASRWEVIEDHLE